MSDYMIEPYVYYDERYPSHWINQDVAKHITKVLENKGFEVIDADETKKLMERAISESLEEEIVVVFSQDVIPEKLVDNPTSPTANSLIRKFLNNGHSIVWIGDIPLLHVGFSNGEKRTLSNTIAQQVLGLDPSVPSVSIPVRLTYYGYMLQLPIWIGTRPHKGLASNISGVRLIPLSVSPYGNHAFIISYYKGHTMHAFSGFVRLYDMMLDKREKINEDIIRGIINVVFRNPISYVWREVQRLQERVRNIEEDLRTAFSTLKSELNNLGKTLDKILKLIEKERNNINSY